MRVEEFTEWEPGSVQVMKVENIHYFLTNGDMANFCLFCFVFYLRTKENIMVDTV